MSSKIFHKKFYPLLENFVSFSLFKVVDAIIPLIVIPYLITVVGDKNYGIYAFAYALVLYLLNIVQYGFSLSGVRIVALYRDNQSKLNKIYNQVFTTQIVLTVMVLMLLILLVIIYPIFREHTEIYLFFSLLLIGETLTPLWLFMGIEKMRFITIVNVISKSTFAIFVFVLIKNSSDFVYIALYQSIGYLVAGIAAQYIITRKFNLRFSFASLKEVKLMLKDGFSSFLTLITPMMYTNTSIFLLGIFGIPQYVGYMQIGTKVSGAFSVLNTILTTVFYPLINRKKHLFVYVKYLFVLSGLVLSLAMFFFAEELINLWIKGNNPEIIETVQFLSPSPFLASIISTFGVNGLMVNHQDRTYMVIVLIGSLIGMISAFILIPNYYYIGGSLAIVLALSIKALLSFIYDKKTKKNLALADGL